MTTKITIGEKIVHPDETRNIFVDFTKELEDTADTIVGTPSVSELTSTDLTIANIAIGTASFTDADDYVWGASKYITFTVSGMLDDTDYDVKVTATTSAANAETLTRVVRFLGRDR